MLASRDISALYAHRLEQRTQELWKPSTTLCMLSSKVCLQPWHYRPLRRLAASLAHTAEGEDAKGMVDIAVLASLLRSCQRTQHGKLIHHHILRYALEHIAPLPSLLVLMYANCAALDDAHSCLSILPPHQQNVFTWNFLFKACALQGLCLQALQLYNHMVRHDVMPNKVTFLSMLDACAVHPTHSEVVRLHGLTMGYGFDSDAVIGTVLLNLYGKVGSLPDAARVFNQIFERDVVMWTSMISVCVQQGQGKKALQFFEQMQWEGVVPDKVTYITAVAACDSPLALSKGRQINSDIVENKLEADVVVGTALVNMYGKCGSLEDARTTFCQMAQRNVVTWNALIGVYSQHNMGSKAFQYITQMQIEGVFPNRETYINMLAGCTNHEVLAEGMQVHACLQGSGIDLDITVGNVLVNMYGKCSSMENARKMFDRMPEWNVVSWTAMITAYAQHGEFREAIQMLVNMELEGVKPNEVTFVSSIAACTSQATLAEGRHLHLYIFDKGFESNDAIKNALLNMYVRFGSIEDAQWIFDNMHLRDAISWTAMIAGFAEHGRTDKALRLYDQMQQEGKQPNEVSFVNILSACAAQAALAEGRQVHACIVENGLESNVDVGNALINMYGKSGSLEDAHGLFSIMLEHDVVSWNTLLTIFAQHGHGKEAIGLFNDMKHAHSAPDRVTFSSVLTACSHAGLVLEAWQLFTSVEQDYGIFPAGEHYICMVDLLGRAGCLDEAEMLISFMPIQPIVLSFMALLAACQYHAEVQLGECAAKYLIELDPENSAPYVVLSNIYATVGWENDANIVKNLMQFRIG